ncbi:MAG TPA: ATP-binding protein [Polyangiaceae bacterium]|nr:ATP-binding protein [Polyangiaceae bacterium]
MDIIPDSLLVPALFAASEDGLVVWGADGRIISFNRAAERILGVSAKDAIGKPIAHLFEEELPNPSSFGAGTDADPPRRAFNAHGIRRDGQRVSLSVRASPIRTHYGTLLGAVASLRPTAPSAGAGHAGTTDSDAERLNVVLVAARLGDWSWDAATDIVTFSVRAAEIFGIPPGPHMTWTALRARLHADDREYARVAVEHALASRGNYSIEYRVINEGSERWVAASGRGWYGERGEILGMFGVVQEITSDRLLSRLDDAVRPLVDAEDITFTAASLIGQHLNVDRCAYASVEDDEDTFLLTGNYTNGVASIVGRYRFRQFGEECLRSMRAGQPYVVEDAETDGRIRFDDRPAYLLTSIRAVICVPILKSNRLVAAMAVHMQTPRTWTASEVELVQRVASRSWESIERSRVERDRETLLARAESANRTKDEFLAMLGHELRNPLAPISTALQLMKLQHNPSFERERTVIERQVAHLTRLVDDLLDVSRIARAKVRLEPELLELSEIVQRALEVVSPLLEERAHTLVLDVPARGLLVEADAARMTQVLSNLLTNACKYTPPGGRLTVSAGSEGSDVVVSVQDNGMGISAEALPRVFDLFVQGQQAIDRAHGGLGLGLTIVRSLVERHGGTVSAHSHGQDRGSQFIVRLPRARAQAVPLTKVAALPSPDLKAPLRRRVLVVDDNTDAAEMLAEALALRGCEVELAHDAPRALELAETRAFDAALLDIGLPVIDGYELVQRLRAFANFRDTRFIAVTGYGQPADKQRALAAGFHHHLVKPVDLRTLETLVTNPSDAPPSSRA